MKADAFEQPYFTQNAPMEVMDSDYRPDPQVHSTDGNPDDKLPKPATPGAPPSKVKKPEDRNGVLTSPLPLVVSAPEAIEKMEALNDLVKEGRPDLAQAAEQVGQALDQMERQALGDAYAEHEVAEGELPGAQGEQPQFMIGDRVVIALEDGEYQGEVQTDNGDGTYDIKTDQMATFRRVPAASIAKPEMLQPIAPRASKETKKMPKRSRVKADKVKADMMEKQVIGPVDGVEVQYTDGESFVMPWDEKDGDGNIESVAKFIGADPATIGGVDKIHGFFGRYSAPGYLDATEWLFDQDKAALEAELERIYGLDEGLDASQKIKAMKEGYKLVDGVHVVEEKGQPRAFKESDDIIPADLYVNPEGKLALMQPDGEASYEDEANDEVELAYWKTVHSLIPQEGKKDEAKKAEPDDAKSKENVQKWAEKAGVNAKKKTKASKDAKAEPTPVEKLLDQHKITAAEFWVVEKGQGVQLSDAARLGQALTAGLKPEAVLGIFADQGAAERFAKIVGESEGGKQEALNKVREAQELAQDGVKKSDKVAQRIRRGDLEDLAADTDEVADKYERAGKRVQQADEALMGSKIIAHGKVSDLSKDETFAAVIAEAKLGADKSVMVLASKDGVLTAAESTALYKGQENDPFFKLADALKAEGFMGLEVDYPGFYALYNIPGLPKGYTVYATPWHNDLEKVDVQVTTDDGMSVPGAFWDGIIGTEDTPTDQLLAAYKDVVTEIVENEVLPFLKAKGDGKVEAKVKADRGIADPAPADWSVSNYKTGEEFENLTEEQAKAKFQELSDANIPCGLFQDEIPVDGSNFDAAKAQVEASAFDQIPELDIGGGYKARRKKGGKAKEGEEAADEIEVVDKEGKVVETYPDAFGDDTVMIIKFLRQVMNIKESDDKKAAKAEAKEDKGGKAEDKPKALPNVDSKKESEDSEKKDKETEELKARAAWMERRVEDCREVVAVLLRKGHVMASQDDIDSELLKGKTLRQAQEVAARKAVDKEVMRLLAKPEAELQIVKASLPHLPVRQMKVQASVGGLEVTHLSASGLIIDESQQKRSGLGLALSAAFHR